MGSAIDDYVSSISQPDIEAVSSNIHALSLTHTAPQDICDDCGKSHIRRRVVCCVDGTWMLPDGTAGKLFAHRRVNIRQRKY
jgi:hypothetical protein